MEDLSVSLSTDLKDYVESRVAAEGFQSPAAYVEDLIRRDQSAYEVDRDHLRGLIEEGIASGVVDQDADQVLDEIIAELRAEHG
jgi:antitoxin ParD1/3/4